MLSIPFGLLLLLPEAAANDRQWMSLDGDWQFTLLEETPYPGNYTATTKGTIKVPGAWEAQGFGSTTMQMLHQVVTGDNARGGRGAIGLYSKMVTPPACTIPGSKQILTVDQGVHRHGIFKVAGKVVGEHRGYLTPFEVDISAFAGGTTAGMAAGPIHIEVELDGGRNPASDPLQGTCDIDDDGTGLGGWAGLNGHIGILCRPPLFIDGGIGNAVPPHIQHPAVTTASTGEPLEISVSFVVGCATCNSGGGGGAVAGVEIFDNASGTPVKVGSALTPHPVTGNVTLKVTIAAVKLWSPENRSLYTATVTLLGGGAGSFGAAPSSSWNLFDSVSTRFGVRTVVVDGYKIMLNGNRLYLAGYGDDSVYPLTVSPPRTKAEYAGKLEFAHEHGFNFVRHHSHTLPPEYFDAADEWGLLISPELPCVYSPVFNAANATGQELYLESWSAYIAARRNHPSMLVWTLCNEMLTPAAFKKDGITFGAERFHAVKQALDPDRLMNDQDGACDQWNAPRDTLSFCSQPFDVRSLGCLALDREGRCLAGDSPEKYYKSCDRETHDCESVPAPRVPVVSHETGNYNTYPRLVSLIAEFESSKTTIRPFWLSGAVARLNASGLLAETDLWSLASEQLYVQCWKIDVEGQRHNSMLSGYEWWLLQDFWTGNNGIVDTFMRPKPGVSPYIKQFNARSIFLEVGLELVYVSNDILSVDILLSNFGDGPVPASMAVAWSVRIDGKVAHSGTTPVAQPSVPQGENGVVASINVALPDVGTTASVAFGATDGPKTVTVTVSFVQDGSIFAATVPENSWNATLFPHWVNVSVPSAWGPGGVEVTDPVLLAHCGFADCTAATSSHNPARHPAVILTRKLDGALLSLAAAGSVVVLLQDDAGDLLPSVATPYKQAWWLGDAADNNAGTLVYGSAASVLGGMAPDMYAAQSWFRMLNGAQTFLVDEIKPLPGTWDGPEKGTFSVKDGTGCTSVGCPPDFPFLTKDPTTLGVLCYNTAAAAAAGSGPCGSWCTHNISVGGGCGDNRGRLCAPSTCLAGSNVSAVEAACDAHVGCNAINFNSSHGGCLWSCPASTLGPPATAAGSSCCAYRRHDAGSNASAVLMRAIDIVGLSRNKALLMTMQHGKGHIIATGLKITSLPSSQPPPTISWQGPGGGTYPASTCPAVSCPVDFPYPAQRPVGNVGAICYNSAAAAAAGTAPCDAWCTHDVRIGGGCGDNRARVCASSSSCIKDNVSAVEAACDAHAGCNAININISHGGCLLACPPTTLGPPPKSADECCGYWAKATPSPKRAFPEMAWVLDRLVRFAGSKLV